jgi:hypothetical protein
MGRQTSVRTGLSKLFYSIYARNADAALQALVLMGVLVPGGDQTSVKRTAQFFINSFYERLENTQVGRLHTAAARPRACVRASAVAGAVARPAASVVAIFRAPGLASAQTERGLHVPTVLATLLASQSERCERMRRETGGGTRKKSHLNTKDTRPYGPLRTSDGGVLD